MIHCDELGYSDTSFIQRNDFTHISHTGGFAHKIKIEFVLERGATKQTKKEIHEDHEETGEGSINGLLARGHAGA